MPRTLALMPAVAAALAIAIVVPFPAAAQGPSPLDGKTAEQVYKNIQVMQGVPADQLIQSMHLIEAALGVECEYCHVSPSAVDAPKDDKPPKQTARKMITMVMDINKNSFGGRQQVTCFTCHRGSPNPVALPALPTPVVGAEPAPQPASAAGLPTIDQILDKYVQALGGEQAIRRVTSRMITATQDIPTGPGGQVAMPSQFEQYRQAPNLVLNLYHTDKFTIANGFDGSTQWAQDMNGVVNEPVALDQARAKRGADIDEPLNLKQEYPRLIVQGVDKVNGRDAYVVIGVPQGDRPERLYFDTQTGLLLRKTSVLSTPVGDSPADVNYDDYRDTGSGVKIPFVISMTPAATRSELQTRSTIRVQKVQDNAAIDNSKFVMPKSKPAPAPAPAAPPTVPAAK